MGTTKFSEWVSETHPDFVAAEGLGSLFQSPAAQRLGSITKRDNAARSDNPPPRAISSDRSIVGLADLFIHNVKNAVKEAQADSGMIQDAAAQSAQAMISPAAANRLFLSAAFQKGAMAAQTVQKILLGMTQTGEKLRVDDPTLAGTRQTGRATLGAAISPRDRQKITELLTRFIDRLVGPSSAPAATPLA